jgi:serine/threonine-protein kinase
MNLRQYKEEKGTLSVQELVQLSFNISEAINTIWQFSKIHRDIKPGNIMIRETSGEFVLLDMGLVFDLQDESLSVGIVGTPLYFSPEQMDFSNRRTIMNFRSDLFSLGIVLYEMATGKHPFITASSPTTWDVLGNIANMNPEQPLKYRPDLPQKLNEIIMRLLAKRPALRYRSIALFQRALGEVQVEGGAV